jgi:antitoxin component YwqK of YwqJK toxin-antitoxin module
VRNGKIEGHVKEYYENGSIKIEESYKNGKAEGIAKIYYENGKIKEEASFKNGKRYGLKFYFLNGAVIEVEYQNNSAASGVCISANGKRTPLTDSELIYLNKGEGVICQ